MARIDPKTAEIWPKSAKFSHGEEADRGGTGRPNGPFRHAEMIPDPPASRIDQSSNGELGVTGGPDLRCGIGTLDVDGFQKCD